MTKLSIIIPFKGQTESDLAIPLASINGQIGINSSDFDVHLVNDGGPSIDFGKFEVLSNLSLHYHELPENVGPGLARQYGIDHSNGEYLMFVDSDDELHYAGALLEFFNILKGAKAYDIIIGRYIEQYMIEDGSLRYTTHPQMDKKAVYAKCFRRGHLDNIGLRFHPDLRIFEDNYFVGLACMLTGEIFDLNSVVYSWLYNPNSIVRSEANFFSQQTVAVAQAMHPYFLKLQERAPELLKGTIDGYMNNIYLRYCVLEEGLKEEFWRNHLKVMEDFSSEFSGYNEAAQDVVNQSCQVGFFAGVDPSGLKNFVEQSVERKGLS